MPNPTGTARIVRKPLLAAHLQGGQPVGRVEVKQIDFAPGQRTGRHLHPCPVVGYIAKGTVSFQIDGEPAQTLHEGDAFYEPAGTTILKFDNASDEAPLTFIAFYLLGAADNELIRMLD